MEKYGFCFPGIDDYSSDIINPHGGFPIDVWSGGVFGKLSFGREPKKNRDAWNTSKTKGLRDEIHGPGWLFLVVQDLENLSNKLGKKPNAYLIFFEKRCFLQCCLIAMSFYTLHLYYTWCYNGSVLR